MARSTEQRNSEKSEIWAVQAQETRSTSPFWLYFPNPRILTYITHPSWKSTFQCQRRSCNTGPHLRGKILRKDKAYQLQKAPFGSHGKSRWKTRFKPRKLSSNDSRKHPSAKSLGFCALPQTECTGHNSELEHQTPRCTMRVPNPRPRLNGQELALTLCWYPWVVFQSQLLNEGSNSLCCLGFKHFGGRYSLLLDNWRGHLKGEQVSILKASHSSLCQQRV